MKEVLRRALSGAVYIILLLSAVFMSSDAFDFLFMTFGLACLYEYKRLVHLKGYHIFIAYLALWWTFIYLVHDRWLIYILMFLTISTNIVLLFFLFSKKDRLFQFHHKFLIGLLYIGGGCIFLTMIPYKDNDFAKLLIMGIFILIWVNDSFAYLVGSTLGRTKLFPAVSPKKTIEGTLGGLVFTLIAAYLLGRYETMINPIQWLILASVIVLFGTLGDLIESKFKRIAGVKDSGAIIPGHGGMLDRLDSMVFAAPFAYLTLKIFTYVS
ncbi:phosphatidate cytidylyltransferase [Maribacter polysiphoniae]|uniref:phosphatidate cytidylyltransferase n=1 Tax=Maribacter polysiphoniae TaxID=429344 RepID=UPI0023559B76|nr:phosphatidate cytidylyltransferase [Maribacter polysiphoniae]